MHWNNAKFHKNVTVGGVVYSTDHKHVAIFGTKDYTGFGESSVHSYIYGKDVGITASNTFFADSVEGSYVRSQKNVNIQAGTYVNLNGASGITVNNSNYGTSLPTTGNVEGRVFFKLIS